MSLWKNYHLATSIEDALSVLSSAPGHARPVAGGTDLLLDLQQGRHSPVDTLVDVSAIPEMGCLEIRDDRLYVGAAVPLNQVVASPLVQVHAQALVEAGSLIGGPQVRNTATLGGNVSHALPAGDGTIALTTLNAVALIASRDGQRLVPMLDLFIGPGKSALLPKEEILVGFHLPLRSPGEGSAFRRVMRPQGVAIAILNMGAWVRRQGDLVVEARIALGPAGPTPRRAFAAEQALRDRTLDVVSLAEAEEALLAEARFRTSPHRATAEYRRYLAGILLRETLSLAWERAA